MKKILFALMVLAFVSCSKTEVVEELPEATQIISVDFIDQNAQVQSSNQIQIRLR